MQFRAKREISLRVAADRQTKTRARSLPGAQFGVGKTVHFGATRECRSFLQFVALVTAAEIFCFAQDNTFRRFRSYYAAAANLV